MLAVVGAAPADAVGELVAYTAVTLRNALVAVVPSWRR